MAKARTASQIVGEQLRAWRETSGLRQDDVAWAARELSLQWTRDTVAAVEGGRREVRLDEFLMLSLIVDTVSGRSSRYSKPDYFLGSLAPLLKPPSDESRELMTELAVGASQPPSRLGREYLDAQGDAERKAARRLGTTPFDVAKFARHLWGRSLTEKRDALVAERVGGAATPRTLQAHRGHVTRELLDELRGEFNRAQGNIDEHATNLWGRPWDAELDARASDRDATDNAARMAIYREMAREIRPVMDAAAEAEED